MKRAIAMALIASTLLAGLAAAQPSSHGAAKGEGGAENSSGRSMDAPYLAVPVVRNGQLVNYLFVSIRIEIAPGVDLWRTRERAQFLRDALVRACHTNQLADPNNPNRLNEAAAVPVFRAAAIQSLGENAVRGVSIVSVNSSSGRAS